MIKTPFAAALSDHSITHKKYANWNNSNISKANQLHAWLKTQDN